MYGRGKGGLMADLACDLPELMRGLMNALMNALMIGPAPDILQINQGKICLNSSMERS